MLIIQQSTTATANLLDESTNQRYNNVIKLKPGDKKELDIKTIEDLVSFFKNNLDSLLLGNYIKGN